MSKSKTEFISRRQMRRSPLATKGYVNRLLKQNIELKYKTLLITDSVMTKSTQAIQLLNDQVQGTGQNDRDGRQIRNVKLELNIYARRNSTPTYNNVHFKIYVIVARATRGSAPTWPDIFTQASGQMQYFRNLDNINDYKILREISVNSSGITQSAYKQLTVRIPKKYSIVQFDDSNNANWSDSSSNQLFLAYTCDEPASFYAFLSMYTRLYFTDA